MHPALRLVQERDIIVRYIENGCQEPINITVAVKRKVRKNL